MSAMEMAVEILELLNQLPEEGKQKVLAYAKYLKRQCSISPEMQIINGCKAALSNHYGR